MTIIDTLIGSISQKKYKLSKTIKLKILFFAIGLQYAYSQLNLYADTAKHSNCNIVDGDISGTYRIKPVFLDSPICLPSSKKPWIIHL